MSVSFIVNQSDRMPNKLNQSLLLKSQNLSQESVYIKYDMEGNTSLVEEPIQFDQQYSYRKVHLEKEDRVLGSGIDWIKQSETLSTINRPKGKIIMRSLRQLYEKNFRPDFFHHLEQTKSISFQQFTPQIPLCLYQMDHLSQNHIKSLFVTQNYSEQGNYKISINEDGRFRLVTVSDQFPVFSATNQHIWGVEEPWKMVLLKAWACMNQGYSKILNEHVPFKFLEYFSSNNWKYYNLEREGLKWFNHFQETIDISYIILQTKISENVKKIGLIPGIAAYNIVQINKNQQGYVEFQVESRFKHKWKGRLCIPNYPGKLQRKEDDSFMLQKNFILTKNQFFQIFGSAYITSVSKAINHITDYVKIQVPKNSKKAIYLHFTITKKGFFDFSFIQSSLNKVPLQSSQSVVDYSNYMKQTGKNNKSQQKYRYLRCKYILIRSRKYETKPFESKLRSLKAKVQSHLTSDSRYEAYEVEYLRGYNKGEAHFLLIEPGEYYFRLKSQNIDKDAIFYLNYCSSEKLNIQNVYLQEEQKQEMLENCMLSLLPACVHYRKKDLIIYSGNKLDSMGYGFIVVQNQNRAEKALTGFFEIDLKQLSAEGFKLKRNKRHTNFLLDDKIQLEVEPNQYLVLIFKRMQSETLGSYYWPPKSLELFSGMDRQQICKNRHE